MPLALDIPKLWERFSFGFESFGLFDRITTQCYAISGMISEGVDQDENEIILKTLTL